MSGRRVRYEDLLVWSRFPDERPPYSKAGDAIMRMSAELIERRKLDALHEAAVDLVDNVLGGMDALGLTELTLLHVDARVWSQRTRIRKQYLDAYRAAKAALSREKTDR